MVLTVWPGSSYDLSQLMRLTAAAYKTLGGISTATAPDERTVLISATLCHLQPQRHIATCHKPNHTRYVPALTSFGSTAAYQTRGD